MSKSRSTPPIRVVIPAYDATQTIEACVAAAAVALSAYSNTEIVVGDNGRNPGLSGLLRKYPVRILLCDEVSGAAFARNQCANDFQDGILVFLDSDVICDKNSIRNLIEPIIHNVCHATIGNYSNDLTGLTFPQKYKQLYISHVYSRSFGVVKNEFWTALCAINARIFHQLDGFNANFLGATGEDQELGIRLTRHDFKVHSVADATGQHRHHYTFAGIIENDFRKGIKAIKNSLGTNIPLTDNRHSGKSDIVAVFFAVVALASVIGSLIYRDLLLYSPLFYTCWFVVRSGLFRHFIYHGGLLFSLKSLPVMYLLDLVRFGCVVTGMLLVLSGKTFSHKSELPEFNKTTT